MNKKPWIKITLIGALVAFVVVDLLLIATSTRVLASALQPTPTAQLVCKYFTGTGFEVKTFPAAAGLQSCPVLLGASDS